MPVYSILNICYILYYIFLSHLLYNIYSYYYIFLSYTLYLLYIHITIIHYIYTIHAVRPDLHPLLTHLATLRIRTAISTRSCEDGIVRFIDKAKIHRDMYGLVYLTCYVYLLYVV